MNPSVRGVGESGDVSVNLSPDEAESLCWAYCGDEDSQSAAETADAINKFRIAARMGGCGDEHGSVRLTLPRDEAEAMGFAGDQVLIDRVLDRINEAL